MTAVVPIPIQKIKDLNSVRVLFAKKESKLMSCRSRFFLFHDLRLKTIKMIRLVNVAIREQQQQKLAIFRKEYPLDWIEWIGMCVFFLCKFNVYFFHQDDPSEKEFVRDLTIEQKLRITIEIRHKRIGKSSIQDTITAIDEILTEHVRNRVNRRAKTLIVVDQPWFFFGCCFTNNNREHEEYIRTQFRLHDSVLYGIRSKLEQMIMAQNELLRQQAIQANRYVDFHKSLLNQVNEINRHIQVMNETKSNESSVILVPSISSPPKPNKSSQPPPSSVISSLPDQSSNPKTHINNATDTKDNDGDDDDWVCLFFSMFIF